MAFKQEIELDFAQMGQEMFEDYLELSERYIVPPPIDDITGQPTGSDESYSVLMLIDEIENVTEQDEVVVSGIVATILQADLPVTPKQGDEIEDRNGQRYLITEWEEDAAHVTWELTAQLQ